MRAAIVVGRPQREAADSEERRPVRAERETLAPADLVTGRNSHDGTFWEES
jgi:hypothetical protein